MKRVWLRTKYPLFATHFLALAWGLGAPSLQAQGFNVVPMKVAITARPGSTVERQITIQSMRGDMATTVSLEPVVISQDAEGVPFEVEPEIATKTAEPPSLRSCSDWISLGSSSVSLAPLESKSVSVRLRVPPNTHGYYYAGIRALQLQPGTGEFAINVRWVFLPLVLVTVEGPVARPKLTLSGAEMVLVPRSAKAAAFTAVKLDFANQGESFSRVRGTATVEYQAGSQWRRITQVAFKERGIFPGISLSPAASLERALPAGNYRVRGQIFADDRPAGVTNQVIAYAGDPSVKQIVSDTAVDISPASVAIQAIPGSRRSSIVTIRNPGETPVQVTCEAQLPPALKTVSATDAAAVTLDCAPWIDIQPKTFTLRGGGSQSVRLTASLPADVTRHPTYYASLLFHTAYADGQNAGDIHTPLKLVDPSMELHPSAKSIDLRLEPAGKGVYSVAAKFQNTGDTDIEPSVVASVDRATGASILSTTLDASDKVVLPLATAGYSGDLNFSDVAPGQYALNVAMAYADRQTARHTLPIKVALKSGRRVVTVIGMQEGGMKAAPKKKPAAPKEK